MAPLNHAAYSLLRVLVRGRGRFDLPEERAIVKHLVRSGYAVVAPGSKDRVGNRWVIRGWGRGRRGAATSAIHGR